MYASILRLSESLAAQFGAIPSERMAVLTKIANYIKGKQGQALPVRLVFICTHNSRRSHFGQVAAAVAAAFYQIPAIEVFSGGTEATAFHPNAIQALKSFGFLVETAEPSLTNPTWLVRFGDEGQTQCFSKVYDDPANPTNGFAAIMTCSDAEQNCPFVPGTDLRIGLPYDDPKAGDGLPEQSAIYRERFEQILTEMLFVFYQAKSVSG